MTRPLTCKEKREAFIAGYSQAWNAFLFWLTFITPVRDDEYSLKSLNCWLEDARFIFWEIYL